MSGTMSIEFHIQLQCPAFALKTAANHLQQYKCMLIQTLYQLGDGI